MDLKLIENGEQFCLELFGVEIPNVQGYELRSSVNEMMELKLTLVFPQDRAQIQIAKQEPLEQEMTCDDEGTCVSSTVLESFREDM